MDSPSRWPEPPSPRAPTRASAAGWAAPPRPPAAPPWHRPVAMVLLLALGGCAAPTSPTLGPATDVDFANPYVLNELAVAGVQRGDVDTAWVLLERAARLAPHDERILTNLEALRAVRAGKPPPRRAAAAAAAVPPAPPPIWAAP